MQQDEECEATYDITGNGDEIAGMDRLEGFEVRDEASANWVIRQIVERRAYAARCAEWCEVERTRAKRQEEFFLFRYGQQLIDFARQRIQEQGGRRKSTTLPAGTLGFRKEAAKIIVDDEQAVLAWARQNCPELVSIVEHLSKSALNAHVQQTGEVPDRGIQIEPEREKFYIK